MKLQNTDPNGSFSASFRQLLLKYREEDPAELALRMHGKKALPGELYTQLRLGKKAKKKLPGWYEVGCLFTEMSLEQCSSELSAQMKCNYSGKRGLDLSGGLGVDAAALSNSFTHFTVIEKSETLVRLGSHNFGLLEIQNADWIPSTAETFLRNYDGPCFDLVFLDPDRRPSGDKRVITLEDSEPNLTKILPRLKLIGKTILIKLSPMLDIAAVVATLPGINKIMIHSVGNEVKELLVEIGEGKANPELILKVHRKGMTSTFSTNYPPEQFHPEPQDKPKTFLFEPDKAFYKAKATGQLFRSLKQELNDLQYLSGFFTADTLHKFPFGARYEMLELYDFNPSKLKKALKKKGINRINLVGKDFKPDLENLSASLRLKSGSNYYLLLVNSTGGKKALLCKKID